MGLEKASLDTLQKTLIGHKFEEALTEVARSLAEEGDLDGERSIRLTIKFTPHKDVPGIIGLEGSVSTKTPRKSVKTYAQITPEKGMVVDVVSGDPRQTSLLDPAKVVDFEKKREAMNG